MPQKPRRVSELMNPDVVTIDPTATIRAAEQRLAKRGVSGAPVVDDTGRVLGVVSQNDLVRADTGSQTAAESGQFFTSIDEFADLADVQIGLSDNPVTEVMSKRVYSVTRDASAATAANIMRERRIHRLLVIDKGVLVGVVTTFDLLRVVEETC